jgi:cell division protein FtsB
MFLFKAGMKQKKRTPFLIIIVALFLLVGGTFFLFGKQGIAYPYRQLKRDRVAIETARRTIDSLRLEIKKLTSDTTYIERIAREKLGMARQNEKVYKFIEKRK